MNNHQINTRRKNLNKLQLTCQEATQMVVISEFEKLPFKRRIALWYHLFICKVCTLFQKQSLELNKAIKQNESEKIYTMASEKKEAIVSLLNELPKPSV